MKKLFQVFSLVTLLSVGFSATAAGGGHLPPMDDPKNDIRDTLSLQRGAVLFANYCMACHSAKYMRYNRIANDLGWSNEEVIEKMTYGLKRPVDNVMTNMAEGVGLEVFGTEIPDLSLMSRVKGTDYIYSFLRGYIKDENGKIDNKYLVGTAMPNVLDGLERQQSAQEFEQTTRDLTNFLEYIGEPGKVERHDLGFKVIVFLLILLLLAYLLKREYWKDIKN